MSESTTAAAGRSCPRCGAEYPEVARFCGSCGNDVRRTEGGERRRRNYAAHPGQGVWSPDVVTSLMPLASGGATDAFRWALAGAVGLPILAAVLGFVSFAVAAAAVAVPTVYLLYLYDVNEWEDQPVSVVLGTVALAAALSVVWTAVWSELLIDRVSLRVDANDFVVDGRNLLVFGVLAPVVAVVLAQIGPLFLASQRRFDDLIDGLTFGIAAGATFAAAETLMLNRHLILDGFGRIDDPDLGAWLSIVIVAGLLKPVVYGAAIGLVGAGWSGRGAGYDGFGPGYVRAVVEALVAMVALDVGLYLTGQIGGTAGLAAGMVWAGVVAFVLLLRVRLVLHTALLESALEAQAGGEVHRHASRGIAFCSECELPLLDEAHFCVVCGTSVRAASKIVRTVNAERDEATAGSGSFPAPALAEWGAGATPAEGARRSTAVMVGAAVVLVALLAGIFAVIDATTDNEELEPNQIHEASGTAAAAPAFAPGESAAGAMALQLDGETDPTDPTLPSDGGGSGLGGDVVQVGGLALELPSGWDVFDEGNGFVLLGDTESYAAFAINVLPQGPVSSSPEESLLSLLNSYVNEYLAQAVQDLELGEVSVFDIGVPGIEVSGNLNYQGIEASQQGSFPIEGDLEVLISLDTTVLIDAWFDPGTFQEHADDFNALYTGLVTAMTSGF